jgi:predicted aspartyl protease
MKNNTSPAHNNSTAASSNKTYNNSHSLENRSYPAKTFGPKISINQQTALNTNSHKENQNCQSKYSNSIDMTTNFHKKRIEFTITLGNNDITSILDTGAELSTIPKHLADKFNLKYTKTDIRIQTFCSNNFITPIGVARNVSTTFSLQTNNLDFLIVDETNENSILLGMDFFTKFNLYIC